MHNKGCNSYMIGQSKYGKRGGQYSVRVLPEPINGKKVVKAYFF